MVGSYVQEDPLRPAVYVSWDDLQEFVKRLTRRMGRGCIVCRRRRSGRMRVGREQRHGGRLATMRIGWESVPGIGTMRGMSGLCSTGGYEAFEPVGLYDMPREYVRVGTGLEGYVVFVRQSG